MPTLTTFLKMTKPDIGQTNWGPQINANLDLIDARLVAPWGRPNVVTSTQSAVFDLSKSQVQYCKLTTDVLSPVFQNPQDGQPYKFIIPQDAVGGHTFAFPASFKGAGIIAPSEGNTAANTTNIQLFTWVAADSLFYPFGPMFTV